MKKRILAFALALCMLLGIAPAAGAADVNGTADGGDKTEAVGKGFKSERFLRENKYRYADDEVVRAIVTLKDKPVAEAMDVRAAAGPALNSAAATTYAAKLADARATVFGTMAARRIDYEPVYEFDTLLNGFSCDVAYGELDKIAGIPGVDTVYIANTYTIPRDETPDMEHSNPVTGNAGVIASGAATGEGTAIAILDGGANLSHEAFRSYTSSFDYGPIDEEALSRAAAQGGRLNSRNGDKVPFAYDYADGDTDVSDSPATEGHGSHVAGIAAGYAEDYYGDVTFSGAAPGAQLVIMKVFSDLSGGTTSDIYFAALEDAFRLGVDVINMSLGSDSGFTYDSSLESQEFGNIYKRIRDAGIILCISAGNSGSMYENPVMGGAISQKGYIGADYTDYGVVGTPSTYDDNISVASMENTVYEAPVIKVGGQSFEYFDAAEGTNQWSGMFGGQNKDYVVITDADGEMSLGKPEDYEGKDVEGKIAVVLRGEINFQDKLDNAKEAGAAGLVVVSTGNEVFYMSIENYSIPAVGVLNDAYEAFMEETTGSLFTSSGTEKIPNPEAGRMSGFSSWGTTPGLTMKPTITSVGGYVNSVDYYGNYGYVMMSGTSMASPNMAGTFANVVDYLKEQGVSDKVERAELARRLLEGTADPVFDEDGYLYSVRKQGVGLGKADDAIAAYDDVYITEPVVELGDSETGSFTFEVELKNNTDSDVTYTAKSAVLTDFAQNIGTDEQPLFANTLTSMYLYNDFAGEEDTFVTGEYAMADVAMDGEVTIPANSSETVEVTVTLNDAGAAYFDECGFINGAFVEGFVRFEAEDHTPVHATFLGYYGDWTDAPALENVDFADYEEAVSFLMLDPVGRQYLAAGYGPYDLLDVVTDCNLAAVVTPVETESGVQLAGITPGVNILDYQDDGIENMVPYNREHIMLSNSPSAYFNMLYLAPFQLRNAEALSLMIRDPDNEWVRYYEAVDEYVFKSAYTQFMDGSFGWGSYSEFLWDGTDMSGEPLPDGTVATVIFDVTLPYGPTEQEGAWTFDVTIDSEAPEIESIEYDAEAGTLTVTASDNHYLAGVYLADEEGNILDYAVFAGDEEGASETAVFSDEAGLWKNGESVTVAAVDYATNEYAEDFELIDSEVVGKPVTVTLVTPAGETSVDKAVGETFSFPVCDEGYNGCRFAFWSDAPVEDAATPDDILADGAAIYGAGETVTLTEPGEVTFYAVFEYGSVKTFDKTHYRLYSGDDYTGDFAINNPRWALDDELNVLEKSKIEDIEWIDPVTGSTPDIVSSCNFNTADSSIRFSFRKLDRAHYTIQNKESGRYLAWKDDFSGLEYADEVTDNAKWGISFEAHADGNDVWIYAGDSDMVISAEGNSWAPTAWTLSLASETPKDLLPRLSEAIDTGYEADRYTTEVKTSAAPSVPSVPFIPSPEPVEQHPTTPESPSEHLVDVPRGAWYRDAVDYVVENGIMEGVSEDSFEPGSPVNRAMMATILYRLDGSPEVAVMSGFADVQSGMWYSDAIAWAEQNGIVNGYSADEFRPLGNVTREQMTAMLYRYAAYKGFDLGAAEKTDITGYEDASEVNGYAVEAMKWAIGEGLIQGMTEVSLAPNGGAVRAQAAVLLMRFCRYAAN